MPNESVDELSVNFKDENGALLCKEIEKEVLTKGTWATIMYKYADLDKASGLFKAPKYSIRRYQKRGGEYRVMSKFTISSAKQAKMIIQILNRWSDADAAAGPETESEE